MKIVARLHLFPPDHAAGAEMMVLSMLRALVARGHECEVWLSQYSGTREPYSLHGVKVFPAWHRGDYPGSVRSCDALLTHLGNTTAMVSTAVRARKPLIQVMHNTHPPSKMWANCKADLVVFNSEWMRDDFGGHPNGIIVRPPVLAEDYRTTPGHAVTLINLCPDKGGPLFWELAERMPDVEFLAVKGCYGDQVTGSSSNVDIVAHGRRMRDVYAATRILLVPSRYESWGRVATEAMCSGIPVIAHPTPGLRENLGDAGTFVDRDDPDAWEAAIRRLMKPQSWAKVSRASRARADELDPTDDLDRWCKAVEGLI